nr:hypothetical protein Iba_chr02cCG14390 [Ipomoea batatas]
MTGLLIITSSGRRCPADGVLWLSSTVTKTANDFIFQNRRINQCQTL